MVHMLLRIAKGAFRRDWSSGKRCLEGCVGDGGGLGEVKEMLELEEILCWVGTLSVNSIYAGVGL